MKTNGIVSVWVMALAATAGVWSWAADAVPAPELWLHPQARRMPLTKEWRAIPMVVLKDGSLLRVAREGRQLSTDDGATWSKPVPVYAGPPPGRHTGGGVLLKTEKGTLLFVYHDADSRVLKWDRKTGETSDDTRNDVWALRSTDDGLTWTDRQHISRLHEEEPYCLSLIQLAQLKDGAVVVPLQPRRRKPNRNVITSVTSRDEGQTWVRSETVLDLGGGGLHDGLLEPALLGLRDGRAYMLLRTNRDWLYESFSADCGATWSEPKPTALDASSSPAFLLRLASGRVLLVWNRVAPSAGSPPPRRQGLAWSREPSSWYRSELSVAFSNDDGKAWSKPVVVARQAARELAYPFALERRPGIIWIITRHGERIQLEMPEAAFCPQPNNP